MDIQEIPRDQWSHFLDQFSKEHVGKQVTLEVYGPGTNPHEEIHTLPLVGVTYEAKEGGSIEVILGTETDDHLSHTVTNPTHVWVKPDLTGDVLELRSEDGLTLLLRLPA